jgi:hypothetical protein
MLFHNTCCLILSSNHKQNLVFPHSSHYLKQHCPFSLFHTIQHMLHYLDFISHRSLCIFPHFDLMLFYIINTLALSANPKITHTTSSWIDQSQVMVYFLTFWPKAVFQFKPLLLLSREKMKTCPTSQPSTISTHLFLYFRHTLPHTTLLSLFQSQVMVNFHSIWLNDILRHVVIWEQPEAWPTLSSILS